MPRAGLDETTVLAAATEMADANGVDEIVLAKLAKKLGVRTPSLYNHVDGLIGLKRKLTIKGLGELYETLTRAAVGKAKDDAVRALAKAYIDFARKHPGLYEATQRTAGWQDDEIQKAAAKVIEPVIQVFKAYGVEDNQLSIHMVRGFRSLLHGFASLEQRGGFGIPVDINESFKVLVDTFLAGIRSYVKSQS